MVAFLLFCFFWKHHREWEQVDFSNAQLELGFQHWDVCFTNLPPGGAAAHSLKTPPQQRLRAQWLQQGVLCLVQCHQADQGATLTGSEGRQEGSWMGCAKELGEGRERKVMAVPGAQGNFIHGPLLGSNRQDRLAVGCWRALATAVSV